MTMIATPIALDAPDDIARALDEARRAVGRGARLVEWRVDALATHEDAASLVTRLLDESPAPAILTCRDPLEGGRGDASDDARRALVEAALAATHPPRYVDIELAWIERDAAARRLVERIADGDGPGVIVSTHDFDGRPADLHQRVERIEATPCAVRKLAWRARSLRDDLEAFDMLADRGGPAIVLCMGRFSLPSRALAPKFGGLVTFARVDDDDEGTAVGQPTIDELIGRFRFASIGRDTRVYGIVGWPVEHSLGPVVHNAGFDAVEHDGVYLPLPVPPEWEHFKATVGALVDHPRLDFAGASVTAPHKTHLVRFVRERGGDVDPLVERIGAANTLLVGAHGLSCTNTDASAARDALAEAMTIDGARVALHGAGGAARAVAAALADAGAVVTVFNRTRDRAVELVEALGFDNVTVGEAEQLGTRFDAHVNCTTVGMVGGPDPDASPIPDHAPIDDTVTVFDTVYRPKRTPLIRDAEARGARIVSGVDMFVRQAAAQFHAWTGENLERHVVENALTDYV